MKGQLQTFSLLSIAFLVHHAWGHGMLVDPPNRSSLWRVDETAPRNYNDNQNFCGGFATQYYQNNGLCGVCGDNYADVRPRANENMGTYGRGTIAGLYNAGDVIDVSVLLTSNHLGKFTYSLCAISDSAVLEEEDCFEVLPLSDGSLNYQVKSGENEITNSIKLPDGVRCEHCVLRWHYKTGNSWGTCEDGSGALGCGPQETFRTCSDIRII